MSSNWDWTSSLHPRINIPHRCQKVSQQWYSLICRLLSSKHPYVTDENLRINKCHCNPNEKTALVPFLSFTSYDNLRCDTLSSDIAGRVWSAPIYVLCIGGGSERGWW